MYISQIKSAIGLFLFTLGPVDKGGDNANGIAHHDPAAGAAAVGHASAGVRFDVHTRRLDVGGCCSRPLAVVRIVGAAVGGCQDA